MFIYICADSNQGDLDHNQTVSLWLQTSSIAKYLKLILHPDQLTTNGLTL